MYEKIRLSKKRQGELRKMARELTDVEAYVLADACHAKISHSPDAQYWSLRLMAHPLVTSCVKCRLPGSVIPDKES